MSEDEGYCLPVFEAMQHGLPVFAFALSPILDLLEGSGITFERKEYPHLAATLHELVHHKKRRKEVAKRQRLRAAAIAVAMDGSAVLELLSPALRGSR
jgi:glycosyltransferase involved in cell wall biosynthesis